MALTLASVRGQSAGGWRCVVCDDSADGSGEAAVREAADPRIAYARNPRPNGMVGNWTFAVETAKTPWVTLLHADDELMPDYAKLMQELAAQHPDAAMFFCRAAIIDAQGRAKLSIPDLVKHWIDPGDVDRVVLEGERGAASLLRGNYIMCPTACYQRQILLKEGFSPAWQQVQDLELYLRLLGGGYTLIGVGIEAYRYRRHGENATSIMTKDLSRFREEAVLYQEVAGIFARRGWTKAAGIARKMTIIKLHLGFRIIDDLAHGHFRLATGKARTLFDLAS